MSCETEMSQLERSIDTIINVFHQYSVRVGHRDSLNQRELKQLVQKELSNFLKVGPASGSSGLGGREGMCDANSAAAAKGRGGCG